jgi:hypothetical protein
LRGAVDGFLPCWRKVSNAVDDVLVRLRKKVATVEKRREDMLESLRKQRNDAALRTARGMVSIEDDQLRRAM